MSRILKCSMTFCGESFHATLTMPDEYFDGEGKPNRHEINRRLTAHPTIMYGDDLCKEPEARKCVHSHSS
jgi:hypothetical protein